MFSEHTQKPAKTVPLIATLTALPTGVHAMPSGEAKPLKLSPLRTSLIQYGAARLPVEFPPVADAPAVDRRSSLIWESRIRSTKAESSVSAWRTIRPALPLPPSSTRATHSPSPSTGALTKWKLSLLFQIRVPEAWTVSTEPSKSARPLKPVDPTSAADSGGGTKDGIPTTSAESGFSPKLSVSETT